MRILKNIAVGLGALLFGSVLLSVLIAPREHAPGRPSGDAAADKVVREFSGQLSFVVVPTIYSAYTFDSGVTVVNFKPALAHQQGVVYGAMTSLIHEIYGTEDAGYFGAPLKRYTLPDGTDAVALESDKYRYIVQVFEQSDTDNRFAGMGLWRMPLNSR